MSEPEIIAGGCPMLNPRHTDPRWVDDHHTIEGTVLEVSPLRYYRVMRWPLHDGWRASSILFTVVDPAHYTSTVEDLPADLPAQTRVHPSREMAMVACERHLEAHP
jgi:hypothetical protein